MTDPSHKTTIRIGSETIEFLRAIGARMKLLNEDSVMMRLSRPNGQAGDELVFRIQILNEEPNGKETIPSSGLHP